MHVTCTFNKKNYYEEGRDISEDEIMVMAVKCPIEGAERDFITDNQIEDHV